MPVWLSAWLGGFFVTQIVEVPIYAVALRGRLHIAFLASMLTHPIVWFVLPEVAQRLGIGYWTYVVIAEAFAVSAEALLLAKLGDLGKKAWGWALVANASSVASGLLCRHFFGWP